MFDYAFHARTRLGVEPIILHDARIPPESAQLERFVRAFPTHAYESEEERQRLIERERIDVAYFLKTGRKPIAISKSCRTAVHEVFRFFHPHGDAYAYISSWLAKATTGARYPAVPHIVDLPSSRSRLRAQFGVPENAFVVGRHGARDQLNVPFIPEAIEEALRRRKDLWLMLVNTDRFSNHERIVHIPRIWRSAGRRRFRRKLRRGAEWALLRGVVRPVDRRVSRRGQARAGLGGRPRP